MDHEYFKSGFCAIKNPHTQYLKNQTHLGYETISKKQLMNIVKTYKSK